MSEDQAKRLRELYKELGESAKSAKVLSITSGKGGVGKSNFALNFALSLMEQGKKVVLVDLDIGMANLDILMGSAPSYHLLDMIRQRKTIWDILEKGPNGIEYIAGGNGFQKILDLNPEDTEYFFTELEKLHDYADIVIIDTGAGLTKESQRCHLAADEIILVTTPEPTSITDSYSVLKILHGQNPDLTFRLVINRVKNVNESLEAANKLKAVTRQFLQKEIAVFGAIADDPSVSKAVIQQVPFYLAYPNAPASKSMKRLAQYYVTGISGQQTSSGMKGFVQKLSRLIKK
jgi:flagellar biosynthesis protein FlhG